MNNNIKVVYILYNELHFYPPCVSQIRMLKKIGYDVEVLYGNSDINTINLLLSENIKCIDLKYNHSKNKVQRLFGVLNLRRKIKKIIKEYNNESTIYWLGNAQTAVVLKGMMKRKKYIVSLLELYEGHKFLLRMLHGIVENAKKITVCEETRGYIIKSAYNLKYLPTVFPNKSFQQIETPRCKPTNIETKKIIDEIKNDNVIIYQGYIMDTGELYELASALNSTRKKYKLVLMGIDNCNVYAKLKKIYDNTIYYNYVPAPLHLEVTSYARIGLLFYEPKCLNFAFCAPNKIYEYSAFSIPMIGNDIPGLKNTIGISKAGICVKMDKDNIKKAIDEIENNYEFYSKNSRSFFDSCDSLQIMTDFMEEVKKNDKQD